MKAFLTQLGFLTRIPVPLKIDFNEDLFARGVVFSPFVGMIVGLGSAAVYYAFWLMGESSVGILCSVIALIIITGGLHLDGLADTFDGLFSNRQRERILEIMKDSRIGTNGTLVIICALALKAGFLLSLSHPFVVKCLITVPAVSRMTMAWSCGISDYAREEKGLGEAIVKRTGIKEIVITTVLTFFLVYPLLEMTAFILIAAASIFTVIFVQYSKKKIGGVTGDVIGAVIEMSEVVIFMAAVVLHGITA